MKRSLKAVAGLLLPILITACATRSEDAPDRSRTILTQGAAQVIAEEGEESPRLICRNQRLPGSYRIRRICQSSEEYEAEIARNRRFIDDAQGRGTVCDGCEGGG